MHPSPSRGSARGIHRILEDRGEASAARVALAIRRGGTWRETTYAELSARVRRVSAFLAERSSGAGSRLAILSESRPEWAMVFLAAVRNGAVVVPLDPKLTVAELRPIVADSSPRVLFASPRHAASAVDLLGAPSVVLLERDPKQPELRSIHDLEHAHEPSEHEPRLDDCAMVVYTSGTTGRPKGVMLSYRNLVFQADTFERDAALGERDVFVSMLPLNHVFELTCGLLSPLNAGAQVCYCDSLLPDEILEATRERAATRMLTVPAFLRALHRTLGRRTPGGSEGWPVFHCGGAPLDREVAGALEARGITVLEGYGLTETSPVVATNLPGRRRPGSVGLPLPGSEVRISPEDGEILVRGPHVMLGYLGQEALTRGVLDPDGWLHTGDIGRLDGDGFLYVTGRLKSLIVLPTGKKVQPEEVESVLSASPNVKEVLVLGRAATSGEEVHAVAVPSDSLLRESGEDAARVRSSIEQDFAERLGILAPFKRPARIHVLDRDLPRTTTGKVRREEVLRILDAELDPR